MQGSLWKKGVDNNEVGIDGVTVDLLDIKDSFITRTITANGGIYRFSNLEPGNYRIRFSQPVGFSPSPRTGFGDNNTDNNNDK